MIRPGSIRWRRAVVPLVGAVLLVGVAASVAARPSATPALPSITPDRLIASMLRSLAQDRPLSGHLRARLDLGLPSIPDEGTGATASDAAGFLSSLTGTHRLRLWSSPDGFRLADLLQSSERAIFISRTDAWVWDFSSFTAYHLAQGSEASHDHEGLDLVDPLALARRALDAITPSTRVSLQGTARTAGRDAYVLALEPRTPETLVGKVEIAVDADKRIPLRVAVIPRDREAAAISVEFTSISFAAIDPSTFRFTPPPGATVRDLSGDLAEEGGKGQGLEGSARDPYGSAGSVGQEPARLFGKDWATIVALRAPPLSSFRSPDADFDLTSLLPLSGPLLSIRLEDRGDHTWLVYGLVPQSALVTAARELP
jgi:outer membrane lipoprotein-sorting protein